MIAIMFDQFFHCLSPISHHSRTFADGAAVFAQDDPVTHVFRVEQGEVRLLRRQVDGAEFILQRATAGALVAEASLMSQTYHCAAVAAGPTRLTIWPKTQVSALISQDTTAAAAYAAHLAREVRTARLRAEIASLRRVSDRLDAWLVWHDGVFPAKGRWHEVAQDINVTPAALYRELAKRGAAT